MPNPDLAIILPCSFLKRLGRALACLEASGFGLMFLYFLVGLHAESSGLQAWCLRTPVRRLGR